jgi:enoyl-CoA hydratase/3-hydroxyacyl-CoA dehydrogenase
MILTGESANAATAHAMGLVDEVVPADRIGARILELHRSGRWPEAARPALDARLRALQGFFAGADVETLLAGTASSDDAAVAKSAGRVRHKAPIGCRLADRMIRTGEAHGVDAGLAMEVAHLREIFSTHDAYEGLTALLAGRRPAFEGR